MPTNTDGVWAALALGAVSSFGLLAGAGSFSRIPHRPIAMAMSVGAGLLLAGVSLTLAADAIRVAGPMAAALSLLLGAAAFSASNALLARFGAAHRKRCGDCVQQPAESQRPGSGAAIALGNALDAVPEGLVLGIALRDPVAPIGLVIAFAVGNFPAALRAQRGCGLPAAVTPMSFCSGVPSPSGSGSNRSWVCRVRFAQCGVAVAAGGIWSRSTARDDCGNDDSRGRARQSAFSGLLAAAGFGSCRLSMPRHVRGSIRLLERAQPAEINAHHLAHLDEDHHDIVAGAAADDDAGPPRYTAHSASGARAPQRRHTACAIVISPPKTWAQHSADRIAVERFHQRPPVAPNRSVLMRVGVTEVNQAGCNRLHETRRTADERERPVFGRPGDLAQEAGVDPTRVSRPPRAARVSVCTTSSPSSSAR